MKTGIVLHNCEIVADEDFEKKCSTSANYLGRPWKEFSQTVIMESRICGCIHPEGWMPWMNNTSWLSTLSFVEYGNTGPGAATDKRVKWPGYRVLSKSEASYYTVENFINGSQWIDSTGVPNTLGLMS
jgi:pectinesterase